MTPAPTTMKTGSNDAALRETFRQLAEEALPESKARMADLIIDRNPTAFNAWARERLLGLIAKLWPKPQTAYQGFLFSEMELGRKLPLPKGESVKFLDATVTQLRASIRASISAAKQGALKRIDPTLERRQQLINEMAPFAEAHHSKDTPFTVARFRELQAQGVIPPAGTRDRSAQAKAAWAKMTPEQRRAAADKRRGPRKPKK